LRKRNKEDLNTFVYNWLTILGRIPELTEELLEQHRESLCWFWSPFQLEEAKEGILVKNYTIHSMPSTGRCKLLDPLDLTCLVYPARPYTCSDYPFTFKIDEISIIKVVLGMTNCPGVGLGPSLNTEEIRENISKSMIENEKDIIAYEKYIEDKGISRIIRRSRTKSKKSADERIRDYEMAWREQYFFKKKSQLNSFLDKGVRFIEPLAEVGLIPLHPLLVIYNDSLKEKER